MRAAILIAAVALFGCQQGNSESAEENEPSGGDNEASADEQPATGETPGEQPATENLSPAPPPVALAAEGGSAADDQLSEAARRRIMGFCVFNLRRTLHCFEDDAYWDTFMTHYYATSGGGQADPEQKQRAIGILKDDILKLHREKRLVENCENMVSTHKLPTEEQMQRVEASYDKSCAEYASALGFMIFHQRVFHDPR